MVSNGIQFSGPLVYGTEINARWRRPIERTHNVARFPTPLKPWVSSPHPGHFFLALQNRFAASVWRRRRVEVVSRPDAAAI